MKFKNNLEKFTAFVKTRAFVYPSSEIYGGLSGVYDYGHYGFLLKENIKNAWIKSMIQERNDVYLLDSAIFMHPKTWVASGHVASFDDPMLDCKECKLRYRADHYFSEFDIQIDDKTPVEKLNEILKDLQKKGVARCLNCNSKNLTEIRRFSLMVKSNLGSTTEEINDSDIIYLRPETCGGIYLQYKNIIETLHPKLPFGVAQVGKAFRNEIVARQFIYRTREFEQMEMQYFHKPEQTKDKYEEWKQFRWKWYLEYGIPENKLKWYKHEKLAHYATEAYDIKYFYTSLGDFAEVEGVHTRGDWDLTQHSKYSGVKLEYFDQETKTKIIPHVLETSVGLGRLFFMFLDNAFEVESLENNNERIVLKLDKRLSPVKIAVLPLLRKEEFKIKAKELFQTLKKKFITEYDEVSSIGKRYRRQDEIGTPYCVTIDHQTLEDNSVTIRERDNMKQFRINLAEITNYFYEMLGC